MESTYTYKVNCCDKDKNKELDNYLKSIICAAIDNENPIIINVERDYSTLRRFIHQIQNIILLENNYTPLNYVKYVSIVFNDNGGCNDLIKEYNLMLKDMITNNMIFDYTDGKYIN